MAELLGVKERRLCRVEEVEGFDGWEDQVRGALQGQMVVWAVWETSHPLGDITTLCPVSAELARDLGADELFAELATLERSSALEQLANGD